jgi:hypothetical protein
MKKSEIIIILIVVVCLAAGAFVILNRPANVAIRKAFKAVSNFSIIDKNEYRQVIQDNTAYEKLITESIKREQELQRENEDLKAQNTKSKSKVLALRKQIQSLELNLDSALTNTQELAVNEQIQLFDEKTVGNVPSKLVDFEGEPLALIDPDRVADANISLLKAEFAFKAYKTCEQIISEQFEQIQRMDMITNSLEWSLSEKDRQLELRMLQYNNLLASHESVLKKANTIAIAGIGVGITAGVIAATVSLPVGMVVGAAGVTYIIIQKSNQ